MKTTAIIILILGLASIATAQYAHPQPNDTGIYTTETKNGDKMTIAQSDDKNSFTVEYNLVDPFNKAVLVVFDMSGRLVLQNEINYNIDQIIIPSGDWPKGQYTCTLFADGKTILTRKITIAK